MHQEQNHGGVDMPGNESGCSRRQTIGRKTEENMISNQILQSTIEGIKNISRVELCVTDIEGKVLVTTFPEVEISQNDIVTFDLERGMKGMNAVNVRLEETPEI